MFFVPRVAVSSIGFIWSLRRCGCRIQRRKIKVIKFVGYVSWLGDGSIVP